MDAAQVAAEGLDDDLAAFQQLIDQQRELAVPDVQQDRRLVQAPALA